MQKDVYVSKISSVSFRFLLVFGFLFLFFLASCKPTGQIVIDQQTDGDNFSGKIEPLKIGAILNLVGDWAFVGVDMQRGIDIAVDKVNARGGIKQGDKNRNRPLKIIYEDDGKAEPVKAVTAANKLISVDNIDAAIVTMSQDTKPIIPIFENAKIPLITLFDATPIMKEPFYSFSVGFDVVREGKDMADFAVDTLHIYKVAIVSNNDDWSELISDSFRDEFEKRGGSIIENDRLSPGTADYKTVLLKVKARGAEGIYAPVMPPESSNFFKQQFEFQLNIPILSGDAFTPDVWEIEPSGTDGVYFTNIFFDENLEARALHEEYKRRYNIEPTAMPWVQLGYDAVLAYAKAMENTHSPQDIAKNLYTIQNLNVSGPALSFDKWGISPRHERIFQLRNKTQVLV